MQVDVSIILPVRNMELAIASMVRRSVDLIETMQSHEDGHPAGDGAATSFEILALDESSVDNTLSTLSVLQHRLPQLRTLQDLDPGTAIARAAAVARGDIWVVMDRPVDAGVASWSLEQVVGGRRAALVPGEILVVRRDLGKIAFDRLDGGLMTAQAATRRWLERDGTQAAMCPAPDRGLTDRALLYLRGGLGKVGLGWLDRPLRSSDRSPDDGGLL